MSKHFSYLWAACLSILAFPASDAAAAPGRALYAAADADQPGDGSAARPYASLQDAFDALQPGDTLLLRAGVYRRAKPIRVGAGGSEKAWVTIKPAGDGEVVIDGQDWKHTPEFNLRLGSSGLLHVEGASYIRIEGLKVINSLAAGILIRGHSHHVEIARCHVETTYSSGISAWYTHHIRILENEVVDANNDELREPGTPKPIQTPHEAISLGGVSDFEIARNIVRDGGKEGIDAKEVSRRGRIHHNIVSNMARQGIYLDAWFGLLEDVTVDRNYVTGCEWGIVLSVEGEDAWMRDIWIHDNVVADNRGSGIYFGRWGHDRLRRNVVVAHNTLWRNGDLEHWSGATGGIDLRSPDIESVLIANNIVAESAAYAIGSYWTEEDGHASDHEIELRSNLLHPYVDLTAPPNERFPRYGASRALPRGDAIVADPRFRDAEAHDFRLGDGSPAKRRAAPVDLPEAKGKAKARSELGADSDALRFAIEARGGASRR